MENKEKSMFEEMREAGSSLPDMVEHLRANGWEPYQHHDNWVRSEWTPYEKRKSLLDTHEAYKRCLENDNRPPTIELIEHVFQALGQASVCWENISGAGEFQSTRATEIGNALMEKIKTDVPNAVNVLSKALANDKDLYYAYQSNIAMPFVDAFHNAKLPSHPIANDMIHKIANIAAKQFLDLLIKESEK
jgi:hypothetical protein